jgi:hypothetical protein
MGAPEHVPVPPSTKVRGYRSPPRRPTSWTADRPGELHRGQPEGDRLGTQGPDQGYALRLAHQIADKAHLRDGEHRADVLSGAAGIAMKRSGVHGRGPMLEDVEVGLLVWGFLDRDPDPELVALRRGCFAEIDSPHQYEQRRRVVDTVAAEVLQQSFDDIGVAHAEDWRELLDLRSVR